MTDPLPIPLADQIAAVRKAAALAAASAVMAKAVRNPALIRGWLAHEAGLRAALATLEDIDRINKDTGR